jgi:hypothetical protein
MWNDHLMMSYTLNLQAAAKTLERRLQDAQESIEIERASSIDQVRLYFLLRSVAAQKSR